MKIRTLKHICKRIKNAFLYSIAGAKAMYKSESAFRQEIALFIIGIIVLFFVNVSDVQKSLLFMTLLFIPIAETVNTAIEVIINRISTQKHPLSELAKDLGSFVVLLSIIMFVGVWSIILI
ncbi:MAG: diacylglycerol kinase [Alphaproteobacteria bacterium]|nr:diacylglycerol kinase [Alphaproteobacteria bacterium]